MNKALAIYNNLEKSAGLFNSPLMKVLKVADGIAATSGTKGLKHLAKYRDPLFMLEKGFKNAPVQVHELASPAGNVQKFIAREIGNTAHAMSKAVEGIGEQKGIIKKVKKGTQNIYNLGKEQLRGASYKNVVSKDVKIISKDGKDYVQGKGLFKSKFFDRPVVGKTSDGNVIIRKRKVILPLSMAMTGPGFAASTLVTSTGNPKKDTAKDRVSAAGAEAVGWSIFPAFAQAKLVTDMVTNKE